MDIIKPPPRWAQLSQQCLRWIPCTCRICHRPAERLLCNDCAQELEFYSDNCEQCGERLPPGQNTSQDSFIMRCAACISKPPPFQRTVFAYRYSGPLPQLIQQFKFSEALLLGNLLAGMVVARLMENDAQNSLPDALIPVPLHPSRLKQRGFNQSLELARKISRGLDLPVYKDILVRTRATPMQSGLKRRERQRNLGGAFSLNTLGDGTHIKGTVPFVRKMQLEGKHLAIVDDVITTGATVREVAKVLKRARPARITVIAVARTQR